jgi:hypothetical protein
MVLNIWIPQKQGISWQAEQHSNAQGTLYTMDLALNIMSMEKSSDVLLYLP